MLSSGSEFGHYRIEELLGEGGMGMVYKAVDSRLDRVVALKLISRKLAEEEDYRVRLAEEARIAAKIDSPNVVKIWEHAEENGTPFISMEYVAGEELRDAAAKLDLTQKVDITRQMAQGIKAAHDVGLIHRDLKPENVRITSDYKAKIFDFGLAKAVRPDTVDAQGNIEGTLHYLSPEQLSGEHLTFSSDLFAFGTILFELFTGERPFEGDFAASIIYSILHEDPPDPVEINEDLPDWINAMILKLLAKQPADRFASVDTVLDHIQHSLGGQTTAVTRETPRGKMSVTVVDIKNLSGDESWNYFCIGFTEDVINEISRRAELVVTAQPSTAAPRDIRECFKRYRTDFIIIGSLMKWQENIKLNLSIYSENGDRLVFGENYEAPAQDLFKLLSDAAKDISISLAEATGASSIDVDDYLKTDVSAYEYYLKGKTYYHTSKEEDLRHAIAMFTHAIDIDPNLALAHSGLADVYAFQYAAYYERTPERIMAARDEAEKAIAIDPNSAEGHRALGRCYMFMDDHILAEKSFLKAIEINPKFAIGYRTMAWLKELEGDHDQAIYWAKRSLELAPTDLETLLLLSLVNMDLKKYTLAMATLQRAIELGPDYGRAYYELGTVYLKLGVTELALENFLIAIKYKGDPNCFLQAGFIYMANKEYDEAVTKFQESIDEGYLSFIAYYFLGYLEKQRNNLMESVTYFNKSIEAGNKYDEENGASSPYVTAYRAMAYAGIDDAETARQLLEQLEQQSDHNGEVLYNIARIHALFGDASKTQEYLDKAIKSHAGPTEKEVKLDPHFAFLTD